MRSRLADYLALTKPRVVSMVLVTTLVGYYLGSDGSFDLGVALKLVIGTALAAGGTLALNQYIERDLDALMHRTRIASASRRPALSRRGTAFRHRRDRRGTWHTCGSRSMR